MAVLCDAISVIVAVQAIENNIPGGLETYRRNAPKSFCTDGYITRVGFMNRDDVAYWIGKLQDFGLVFIEDTDSEAAVAIDIAVVDQVKGPTCEVPWLATAVEDGVRWAWSTTNGRGELVAHDGWSSEDSIRLAGSQENPPAVSAVLHTQDFDLHIDSGTGKVRYTARPWAEVQSYEEAIESARHLASRGDFQEAYRYVQRAESYMELSEQDKALAARVAYWMCLGGGQPRPERFAEARLRAQENTEIGTGSTVANDWFHRARLEAATGDMAAAKACLVKATELDPRDPYPWAESMFVGVHLREPREQIREYSDTAVQLALEQGTFPEVLKYIAKIKEALSAPRAGRDS
jgi:hypothetical protein